ncbi:MAG: hypothetical protein Q8936_03425 [Bacillota bacterium]|nr:hypothetical protein [Bacillota bacterium]
MKNIIGKGTANKYGYYFSWGYYYFSAGYLFCSKLNNSLSNEYKALPQA